MTKLIVRIDLGEHGKLGPGKLMLLQKIDELGSISAAGREMKMSYRQAWGLIHQLNGAFREPVVRSQAGGEMGGGARLTEFGKLLLLHCNAMISNTRRTAQPHLDFLEGVLATTDAAAKPESDSQPDAKPKPARGKTPASN
jgi:molybdate transport system regulatory protein